MKHFLAIALLLCATAAWSASSREAAQTATREGRWTDAARLWAEVSAAEPDDATAVAELGWADMEAGRTADARRQFSRALRLKPGLERARAGQVRIAIKEYRYDDALKLAGEMAREKPRSAEAQRTLGDAMKAASRRSDAEAAYRRAVALEPGNAGGHAALADTLMMGRKLEEAVREYSQAAKLEPQNGLYRESLGRAAIAAGQYGTAAVAYCDAMERSAPATPPDWVRLDSLTLSLVDALEKTATSFHAGGQAREDLHQANTRALAVADSLAALPAVRDSDPLTQAAFSQRGLAYDLIGQACTVELDRLKAASPGNGADAVVFRDQARRALASARTASRAGNG